MIVVVAIPDCLIWWCALLADEGLETLKRFRFLVRVERDEARGLGDPRLVGDVELEERENLRLLERGARGVDEQLAAERAVLAGQNGVERRLDALAGLVLDLRWREPASPAASTNDSGMNAELPAAPATPSTAALSSSPMSL